MLTFNTTSDRIIKILENNLTDLDKHKNVEFDHNFIGKIQSFFSKFSATKFNISKSTSDSIELKIGEYIITLNFKEQKGDIVNMMTDITFNPYKKKKKYGAVEQQTGQKLLNQILGFIYNNLNENELIDESKENYNLIIESEKKSNKIGKYIIYVFIGFIIYLTFSIFDTTIESVESKYAGHYDFGVSQFTLRKDGTGTVRMKAFGLDQTAKISWYVSGNVIYWSQEGKSGTSIIYIKDGGKLGLLP